MINKSNFLRMAAQKTKVNYHKS